MPRLTEFTGKTEYNLNDNTVDQWWNSEYLSYVRDSLITGKELAECSRCYVQEQQGSTSFRQRSNADFGIVTQALETPKDWELQITNLCNLKCMMCNEKNSSSLLAENVILFKDKDTQKRYTWNEDSQQQVLKLFDTLDSAVLRGGEPFMVPWIKEALQNLTATRAAEIELLFNTNLTKLTDDWIPILSKFKSIKISCSIDAYGSLNHYIRYPSEWSDISKGLSVARKIPNANVFLNVCVQNLNILCLHELLTWTDREKLFVVLDVLTDPAEFQIATLPPELIRTAILRLENIKSKIDINMVNNLDGVLKTLYNAKFSDTDWNKFKETVQVRDSHRRVYLHNIIPEFKEYLNAA